MLQVKNKSNCGGSFTECKLIQLLRNQYISAHYRKAAPNRNFINMLQILNTHLPRRRTVPNIYRGKDMLLGGKVEV